MQTKRGSFAEAWANIAVGFGVSYAANFVVLPLVMGVTMTHGAAFQIGVIMTAVSLVRSYILRRWFNGLKFGNTPTAVLLPRDYVPDFGYDAWVQDNWGAGSDPLRDLFIMTTGLAGETGEVCELLKKGVRGREGQALDRRKLLLELGDVLHYLVRIAGRHGLTLSEVQTANVAKLGRRKRCGKDEAAELLIAGNVLDARQLVRA